jgi:hypothetical protein
MIPLAIAVGMVDAATHSRATTWLAYLAILILIGSVTSAASRVFSMALYRYAIGTGATGPFPDDDLRQPFRKRRRET